MEDLSNIVRVRRLTLEGHILRLPLDRPASVAIHLMEEGEDDDVQGRPGDKHSRKIYRRCKSVGVVFAEWLVIGVCGKVLSPSRSGRI